MNTLLRLLLNTTAVCSMKNLLHNRVFYMVLLFRRMFNSIHSSFGLRVSLKDTLETMAKHLFQTHNSKGKTSKRDMK